MTLTYRDDAVPQYGSLKYRDVQLFLKRLRKDHPVRFVCCGEYGPKTLRPHYHLCIFGYFPDDHSWCGGSENERLYSSKSLDKYWGLGETRTGELTFQSAAYVARYVVGKVTGEKAAEHYQRVTVDGEIVAVDPEFMQMSRGGRGGRGIGFEWYKRYCASSRGIAEDGPLGRGVVVVDGRERKQPKYYDKLLKEFNAEALDRISKQRLSKVTDESVSERHIRARAVIARARMSLGRSRGDW